MDTRALATILLEHISPKLPSRVRQEFITLIGDLETITQQLLGKRYAFFHDASTMFQVQAYLRLKKAAVARNNSGIRQALADLLGALGARVRIA